jgi:ribonuclease HII
MDDSALEAGTDEAGRGPLFGRVYAGCVLFPHDVASYPGAECIQDSKIVCKSKNATKRALEFIGQHAWTTSVAFAEVDEIEKVNIHNATYSAMQRSIAELALTPDHILVDGPFFPSSPHRVTTVVDGDQTFMSIAAASILAKVARDEYVIALCDKHPNLDAWYEIRSNKGYGTKSHMAGIQRYGVTQWHRRTFHPCKTAKLTAIV